MKSIYSFFFLIFLIGGLDEVYDFAHYIDMLVVAPIDMVLGNSLVHNLSFLGKNIDGIIFCTILAISATLLFYIGMKLTYKQTPRYVYQLKAKRDNLCT